MWREVAQSRECDVKGMCEGNLPTKKPKPNRHNKHTPVLRPDTLDRLGGPLAVLPDCHPSLHDRYFSCRA